MRIKTENSGFTLIEVVIVIAIIGILSAIAVPGYMSWRANSQFRDVVINLRGDINYARMQAAVMKCNVVVHFAPGGAGDRGHYIIYADNGEGGGAAENLVQDGTERILKNRFLTGAWIELGATDFDNDVFWFNARGVPEDGNSPAADFKEQQVTVSNGTQSRTFVMNRLGRITG